MVPQETAAAMRNLLEPRSVAVIGASDRPGTVGHAVFMNLQQGGFRGALWPVNPRHQSIAGHAAYASALALPAAPDLGVVCTPAAAVPQVISELGAAGTRAAVVLTAGLEAAGPDGRSCADAMMAAAAVHGLRILGPNCVGLRVPRHALNASFSAIPALPGPLALVAQSGGVITAFLAWAARRGVGISCCASLGNATDLTAADLLDALAADEATRAILLYLESERDGRRFIEAAARAARVKPLFALKVGRVREGAAAAATHTGALAGADNVWEAALLAAGVRRIGSLQELYDVAELLARLPAPPSERITMLTNSGGPAVLAVDALVAAGGSLATLSADTIAALDAVLPATWSRRNPVDIIGDASPQRFVTALERLTADATAGTTLVMHVPTDLAASAAVRRECNEFAVRSGRNLVGCWIGDTDDAVEPVPAFETPEQAVTAIVHVAAAGRLGLAARAGAGRAAVTPPDMNALREALRAARDAGHRFAAPELVERVLQAADIAFAPLRLVADDGGLEAAAAQIGYPVALKIQSPDIPHKSDVGGVITGIADAAGLRAAAAQILQRCAHLRPQARIEGFQLQRHAAPAHARELIAGLARDREFGPVLLFGHGGTAVQVLDDTAIGIAPLDDGAAGELIARTRVSRLLGTWRDWPAADLAGLRAVLVRLSVLGLALPEIASLDINPLLAWPEGVLALDARIALA